MTDAAGPRDRPFSPTRHPISPIANDLIADILVHLGDHEARQGLRKRTRKAAVQQTFKRVVTALISDAIFRSLTEPDGWLAVSLSNDELCRSWRYRPDPLGKTLPTTLRHLASPELGLIELVLGQRGTFDNGRQTTFRAGARLIGCINEHDLSVEDFASEPDGEVIVLKRSKETVWDSGGLIDYEDTPITRDYRDQMNRINRWLASADIAFDPSVTSRVVVDATDRRLRRYFNNGAFDQGGRLFGGFWMELKKEERHAGITIDGEAVMTLDYSQMAPRILYGMADCPPPVRDAYALPGLEDHRAGVKKLFSALVHSTGPIKRFPKDTKNLFPPSATVAQVIDLIRQTHEPISHLFGKGIGMREMFTESNILVDVLLSLIGRGIVALPVHDALIVRQGDAAAVEQVMLATFTSHTGVSGLVARE